MQNSGKLFLKVFTALILSIILYSCDFFAPYDLEFVSVSQEKLEFGMFEIEKQFVITNVDSFDVNWEILPAINWITISPMSGKINAADPDTVTVKINRSKLIPGKYSDKIEISFENKTNSKFIELLMEIKAQLRVSQDSMRFGIYDSLKSFKLFNSGNYPLKWSFIADEEWISVQPDTGTLLVDSTKFLSNGTQSNSTSKYSDATVFVKIDNKKISAGDHIGLLHLKTENG
ncbi:MAG: BACON domain-containing protein, partial [Melioribacteraceae bacterium]